MPRRWRPALGHPVPLGSAKTLEDQGGWTNRDIVEVFADYVSVVGEALGDRVENWMIFNEPLSFTMLGYMLGEVHRVGADW